MESARYLPAYKVKAGSLRLGRLSVRSADDHEIGKLLGFVIEPRTTRIRGIVIERDDAQLEVPMRPVQFDARSRSLRPCRRTKGSRFCSRLAQDAARPRRPCRFLLP